MRCPRSSQVRKTRAAFTLIELLVVVAIIALLISILLPSLARARELSRRTVCAANVSGIGKGLYTYANENNDMFPIAYHNKATSPTTDTVPAYTRDETKPTTNFTDYVRCIGADLWGSTATSSGRGLVDPVAQATTPSVGDPTLQQNGTTAVTAPYTLISTTRNLWMLIKNGASSTGSFICPSSSDSKNSQDNPQVYWDFAKYEEISYGYQVPYGANGQPSTSRQHDMPLLADKGPFGNVLEKGNTYSSNFTSKFGTLTSTSGTEDWMMFNSPNHGGTDAGEGQNVLFADSSCRFEMTPTVGVGRDNIYTAWAGRIPYGAYTDIWSLRIRGVYQAADTAPYYAPLSNTDSYIYP